MKVNGTMNADLTLINIFWVLYNGAGLFMALIVAFDRPRYRKSERFVIEKEGSSVLIVKMNRLLVFY
ncbi:hypothetical protein BsIDN1_65900 [Bacillus safensis]|uniref:Uncharacterized protein n=1 Tax=Bacillus safensis TaxID=561879 RepID=A0A5S9MJX7_BACIA|nr:hypothetical protein BsIDN1_65900 [Bacillus safensis]